MRALVHGEEWRDVELLGEFGAGATSLRPEHAGMALLPGGVGDLGHDRLQPPVRFPWQKWKETGLKT
jgi:hypothetical protein